MGQTRAKQQMGQTGKTRGDRRERALYILGGRQRRADMK